MLTVKAGTGRNGVRREHVRFAGRNYYRYPDSAREADRRYFKCRGAHLHRDVWSSVHGPIPDGRVVHHKDGDTGNNEIGNLECITQREHAKRHEWGKWDGAEAHLAEIRPLTLAWHRSEAGRAWHRQHGKDAWATRAAQACKCEQCGGKYETLKRGRTRFCSNACKTKARAASGVDDERRACKECGTAFVVNRYSKTAYCTVSCGARAGHRRRKAAMA